MSSPPKKKKKFNNSNTFSCKKFIIQKANILFRCYKYENEWRHYDIRN